MSARPTAPPLAPAPAGNDQSPERIRSMFAAITPAYDRLNHLLSWQLDRRWRRLAARAALEGLTPCRRLLDVATGTGDLAQALARQARRIAPGAPPPVVLGADFTRPMLTRAAAKYGHASFRWIEADGLRLPLDDGAVDACTIAFGLRNMLDKPAALAEMARVVRPGGRVAVLEFSQPPGPVARRLYDTYAHRVLPRVGAWISGSGAYGYLAESIRDFWNSGELSERMQGVGLTCVEIRAFMLGAVCLHVGTKAKR